MIASNSASFQGLPILSRSAKCPCLRHLHSARLRTRIESGHCSDHIRHLGKNLLNLALADDEWRGDRDGLAADSNYQAFVVEAALQRFIPAPAHGIGLRGEVDAGGEPRAA